MFWFPLLSAIAAVEPIQAEQLYVSAGRPVDSGRPLLTWQVTAGGRLSARQSAYELRAAERSADLAAPGAGRFETGKVVSGQSVGVRWPGPELSSRQQIFWQLRLWDEQDRPGPWSAPASFAVGLLRPEDWQAEWIDDGRDTPADEAQQYEDDPAPLFVHDFNLRELPAAAQLHIAGLGYYTVSFNGLPERGLLAPAWTDYRRRVLYDTYDVRKDLREGANQIAVRLGNGWFNPLPLRFWGWLNLREHLVTGRPRLIAQLELTYTDGRREVVGSGPDWQVGQTGLLRNNIYLGEVMDLRADPRPNPTGRYDSAEWQAPRVVRSTLGPLLPSNVEPITDSLGEPIAAETVKEVRPGAWIFALPVNTAGQASLRFDEPAGTRLTLRYGELLHADGTLNPLTGVAGQIKGGNGGPGAPPVAEQRDVVICDGGPTTYRPRFTFHGCRYIEVEGLTKPPAPGDLVMHPAYSGVETVGTFECSDEALNRLVAVCQRTFLANMFSVQSDCPARERFGYGGDIAAVSEAFLSTFNMAGFYAKTVRDYGDAQRPDGNLTDTAPFVGIQFCGVPWAIGHCHLLEQLVRFYADDALLAEQYDISRRWLELVAEQNPDHLVREGLADHESLDALTNPELITPIYYQAVRIMERLAKRLGRTDDVARYEQLAKEIAAAYVEHYVQADGNVLPGTQSALAIALGTGIVPTELRAAAQTKLLERLRADGRLRTGIFGTRFVWDLLGEVPGGTKVLCDLVRSTEPTGYGYMLANGATTLWEHWEGSDNTYSQNHPMFGSVRAWLSEHLAGLRVAPDAVGSDRLLLEPQPECGLEWVKASWDGPRGLVRSEWAQTAERFEWRVVLPANTRASVLLPCAEGEQATVNGQPLAGSSREARGLRLELGSGSHEFTVSRR